MHKLNTKYKPNPNTFKNTFCVFHQKELQEIEDLAVDYKSDSGSVYYYTEKGMYRLSNHWGRLGNCKWRLIENSIDYTTKIKLGFALWDDFFPDNKYETLYFLEVDYENNQVLYQHKNSKTYSGQEILRTADDTMKRVKQARNILTLTNWAKHFEDKDLLILRKLIVDDLIYTNLSLDEIKRKYL